MSLRNGITILQSMLHSRNLTAEYAVSVWHTLTNKISRQYGRTHVSRGQEFTKQIITSTIGRSATVISNLSRTPTPECLASRPLCLLASRQLFADYKGVLRWVGEFPN